MSDVNAPHGAGGHRRRSLWFVAIVVGVFALAFAPGWAGAWTVSQGSDYTATVNSKLGFKVCDQEADGRGVRGDARDARGRVESESDGGDAGCDTQIDPPDLGTIDALQTCEVINNWPDACTGFHGSTYP